MSKIHSVELFTFKEDVTCLKCGNYGAVKRYGEYYPNGLGDERQLPLPYEKYRHEQFMSHTGGIGGTIPYKCTNCGNVGLIDLGGLEGFKQAFVTGRVSIFQSTAGKAIDINDLEYDLKLLVSASKVFEQKTMDKRIEDACKELHQFHLLKEAHRKCMDDNISEERFVEICKEMLSAYS